MNKMNDFTFAYVDGGFDKHIQQSIRNYDQLLQDVVTSVDILLKTIPI